MNTTIALMVSSALPLLVLYFWRAMMGNQ